MDLPPQVKIEGVDDSFELHKNIRNLFRGEVTQESG